MRGLKRGPPGAVIVHGEAANFLSLSIKNLVRPLPTLISPSRRFLFLFFFLLLLLDLGDLGDFGDLGDLGVAGVAGISTELIRTRRVRGDSLICLWKLKADCERGKNAQRIK